MLRLVRAIFRYPDIVGLFVREQRHLGANTIKMQSCDLLVKVFWQHVDFLVVIVGVLPELNLSEDLVRE